MHHNDVEYWRHLQTLPAGHEDLPSPRVCRLLLRAIEGWKSKPGWIDEAQVGHLFRERRDLSDAQRAEFAIKPVIVRKALAIERMLALITSPAVARTAGSCTISSDELIVGTLPPFSVGQGKEFVRYLTEDEELAGALQYLNELSPMGHIVPDHGVILERGLLGLAADCRARAELASKSHAAFYEAVAISLEAVVSYAATHAALVRKLASSLVSSDPNRASLERVAANLDVAPAHPAKTFHQALQAIYLVHCALHWTVEIVPIGRLDQLLAPFLDRDLAAGTLTLEQAQELVDCFWIKLDERVILDFRHAENRFTAADGVLTGFFGPSNYDQGALLNQWMQQITIGGQTRDGVDACNQLTRVCLASARRLPLNSPTLDLRVHAKTPADILELAARALLSGGAHPVLLNDDYIVGALASQSQAPIPIEDARNYACDGCYETMVAGASEFSFGFVSALDLIEKALNRGAGLAASGSVNLRGAKESWRTPRAKDIASFDDLKALVLRHMDLACHRYISNLLTFYGNKESIAPSPLLSALIAGCLESGRDLTGGGTKYHIFSPLLVGVSSAADSLYAISSLVFDQRLFSLEELTTCLATDWGARLLDVRGRSVVPFGRHLERVRIDEIRMLCLNTPRFGNGHRAVDELGWWLLESFATSVSAAYRHPMHREGIAQLEARYGTAERPFVLHLAPGVGTFEQYGLSGSFNGASADGRRAGQPVASDLSPAPTPSDLPIDGPHARRYDLPSSLASYCHPVMARFGDGCPVDYNIPEDLPIAQLVSMIQRFADGEGGSICTFTAADPATFAAAQENPDAHNLIRVRMGGWTEFFIALFPDHQEQHKRRPLYG